MDSYCGRYRKIVRYGGIKNYIDFRSDILEVSYYYYRTPGESRSGNPTTTLTFSNAQNLDC